MKNIPELFGSMVYNEEVMRARLPKEVFRAVQRAMFQGEHLGRETANIVANSMKNWAVEHGATHFTHWFQPMTGITAEKHDSFITPIGGGQVIMEFSGKALVCGEPDASSFPSGGLRATFEARGYTVWDASSYAFIKDGTLCVPTAFCSYSGEALDKKTPLLRSMEAINAQALRVLRLFGNDTAKRVITTVGPEQEYFLIDKEIYLKRPDLIYTGRTLLGARPPKGQELDDHYFGTLKPRVSAFMKELDEELWKLGVYAKTEHNEVAPAQHELAPVFVTANIATDHNQLTMELLKAVADRHGLACLLHEKPFAGVNGSGKHNNWSMSTDTGTNLLEPGATPHENAQFLLFLTAVIQAADDYQELLRAAVAGAGNDHRLGGNEAPPSVVSMFLGDELTEILEAFEAGEDYPGREKEIMEIGVTMLPHFSRDATDRNRTSPIAFTGNRFEFRMPGSSFSVAGPNFILNTAVAESLRQYADALEGASDFNAALASLVKKAYRAHKRIIFNGNNYAGEWLDEAARRGLSNLRTAVDAFPVLAAPKSVALFTRHRVFSETELRARCEINMEGYCKTLHIEALTMADMVQSEIFPACLRYQNELASLLAVKQACGASFDCSLENHLLGKISGLCADLLCDLTALEDALRGCAGERDVYAQAAFYRDCVCPAMAELRQTADELETLVAREYWPFPTYAQMLYSVV